MNIREFKERSGGKGRKMKLKKGVRGSREHVAADSRVLDKPKRLKAATKKAEER